MHKGAPRATLLPASDPAPSLVEWFWICPEQAFDLDLCMVFGSRGQLRLSVPTHATPSGTDLIVYYGSWSTAPDGGIIGRLNWEEHYFPAAPTPSPSEAPLGGDEDAVEFEEEEVPDVSRALATPIVLTLVRANDGFVLREGGTQGLEWLPSRIWVEKERGGWPLAAYLSFLTPRRGVGE